MLQWLQREIHRTQSLDVIPLTALAFELSRLSPLTGKARHTLAALSRVRLDRGTFEASSADLKPDRIRPLYQPVGGNVQLYRLIEQTGPIYEEWTGRQAASPKDIPSRQRGADKTGTVRHSLYCVTRDACNHLQKRDGYFFNWGQSVSAKTFNEVSKALFYRS